MRLAFLSLALVLTPGVLPAQEGEPKLSLGGVFDLGSSNSRSQTRYYSNPSAATNSTDLNWGFDLSLKTYILDPRFITLTFEPTVHRGTGHTDALGNRDSDTGGTFFLDFLKTSYYPFRFYFIDHSLNYEQEHLSSSSVARRSLGFDWTFRKPKRPPLFISYDTSRFSYEFTLTPATLMRATNFLATTQGTYASWATNLAYSRQDSTQAFTGVGTATDLVRGAAGRNLWSNSQLSINATFERLRLSNQPGMGALDLPFWSIHTDLRTRYTSKLSTLFSHQYYRTGAATTPAGAAATPQPTFEFGTTAFNDIQGQVSYQLTSFIAVSASTDTAFISSPAVTEAIERNATFSGGIHWLRRVSFLQTRAGVEQGISYAASNLGNSRDIPFVNANVGLSAGDPRTLLVATDGTYSRRPDLFEAGGYYTLWGVNASLDSQRIKGFRLRGSAGVNQIRFLTLRGYERFHTTNYSLSITRSIFTLVAARTADISLRNLLFESALSPSQLFITLPVQTLLNSPFSGTTGEYTTGTFAVRPGRRFEIDARYLRQRSLFTNGPSILLRQYEFYATYRLGKFQFTTGVLYLGDITDDDLHHLRRYYFLRMSRPFRLL
jgi:hypothetical protein